jgi:hypothetical protein
MATDRTALSVAAASQYFAGGTSTNTDSSAGASGPRSWQRHGDSVASGKSLSRQNSLTPSPLFSNIRTQSTRSSSLQLTR